MGRVVTDQAYTPGTAVIVGGRLCTIHRSGQLHGAAGHWVMSPTGDPGTDRYVTYPVFAPDWCVTLAVVGRTVCPQPWPHNCGLVHTDAATLARLPVVS